MQQKLKESLKIEKLYGIGTYWYFEFFENVDLYVAKKRISDVISEFEEKYSRFKDTSLISTLNTERKLSRPSAELKKMLELGLDFYNDSKGIFNPGIGAVLESKGYDKNYSFKKTSEEKIPSLKKLLKIEDYKITLTGEGNIDLGGYGKGYLIDKLARFFKKELGLKYFLINGGGDIYITSDNGKLVEILLQNPINTDEYFDSIYLKDCSICSSSAYKRRWKDKSTGEIYNHVVNTGEKELASTYIIAPYAVIADAMATVLMMAYKTKLAKTLAVKYSFKYLAINGEGKIIDKYKFPI